jgi:hypothetical protein
MVTICGKAGVIKIIFENGSLWMGHKICEGALEFRGRAVFGGPPPPPRPSVPSGSRADAIPSRADAIRVAPIAALTGWSPSVQTAGMVSASAIRFAALVCSRCRRDVLY